MFCNVTFVVSAYFFQWNVGSCFTPFQKLLVIKHFSFTVAIYHLIENPKKVGHSYSQSIDFLDVRFLFQQVFLGCSHRLLQNETPEAKLELVNFHLLFKTMMKNTKIGFFAILICVLDIFPTLLAYSIAFVVPGRRRLSGM